MISIRPNIVRSILFLCITHCPCIETSPLKVLIVGGSGREHALAWKAAQSPQVAHVYVAPGNGGTAQEAKVTNVAIDQTDLDALAHFAQDNQIDLTIVGPEAPLAVGITDEFKKYNLRCFGPSHAAAQLEASKCFSKSFMQRHDIPTAQYAEFTDADQAYAYLQTCRMPIVIKADGLAAGKGVIIAQTQQEACDAIKSMLIDRRFGDAGSRIIIEEFLEGEEVSFIVITDGQHILPFATAQDHKTRDDHDQGPNTGGMGAYSPAPIITEQLQKQIMKTIIEPTVQGMAHEGNPYVGFLYAGLMITPQGPKVLEFNCRLGDPETQPIMMRLQSDLVELCMTAIDNKLHMQNIVWDKRSALGVVLASGGYPFSYKTGYCIDGLPEETNSSSKIFHAGTIRNNDNNLRTAGGRVLCVTALGSNIKEIHGNVYSLIKQISWPDLHYRTDIGHRAIARERVAL